MNKPIKFSLRQRISLFSRRVASCCCRRSKRDRKEWKVLSQGAERLEKEMDIVRILKAIRFSKILFKTKLVDEEGMVEIKNSAKNAIAIDSDPDGT